MVSGEELVGVLLPTVLGVGMVLVTVIVVFWLGSGKKRSYEEAKAQASRKAEEVLREKEQTSPKAKKGKKNFRKKKEHQDESGVPPRKGILKPPSPSSIVEAATPERPTPNKVEFKLDAPAKEGKVQRVNPTTPYPNKDTTLAAVQPVSAKTPPQPIFEDEEEEEKEPAPAEPKKTKAGKKQGTVEQPPQKNPQSTQELPQNSVPQKPPAQAVQKPAPESKPKPAKPAAAAKEAEVKQKTVSMPAQKRPKGGKSKLVVGSGSE
jgi:nitrogen fixation-related uncharacterized protein